MEFPLQFQIETARCRLRAPSAADIEHVFSATRQPGFNDGMGWDAPATPEELRAPLERNLAAWVRGESFTFSIDEKATGELVGRVSLRPASRPGAWHIGFWTHPRAQGRGFATEAARAVMDSGFRTLGANEVETCHAVWNRASRRVLEKLGMREMEFIERGLWKKETWVPEFRLLITRAEWMRDTK